MAVGKRRDFITALAPSMGRPLDTDTVGWGGLGGAKADGFKLVAVTHVRFEVRFFGRRSCFGG